MLLKSARIITSVGCLWSKMSAMSKLDQNFICAQVFFPSSSFVVVYEVLFHGAVLLFALFLAPSSVLIF